MDATNIVSDWNVPNVQGTVRPVAIVKTGVFTSTDQVLEDAVLKGNAMDAAWIIGFNYQSAGAKKRVDRGWVGNGVAVVVDGS